MLAREQVAIHRWSSSAPLYEHDHGVASRDADRESDIAVSFEEPLWEGSDGVGLEDVGLGLAESELGVGERLPLNLSLAKTHRSYFRKCVCSYRSLPSSILSTNPTALSANRESCISRARPQSRWRSTHQHFVEAQQDACKSAEGPVSGNAMLSDLNRRPMPHGASASSRSSFPRL